MNDDAVNRALSALLMATAGLVSIGCGPVALTPAAPLQAPVEPVDASRLELDPSAFETQVRLTPQALIAPLVPPADAPPARPGDWIELAPHVLYRAHAQAEAPRARAEEDGALLVELPLRVSAAVQVGEGRRQELRGCGCGGEAWCGGDDEAPRIATARVRVRLAVDARFRLQAETTSELVLDQRCIAAPVHRGQPMNLTPRLRAMLEAEADAFEHAVRRTLERSDLLATRLDELWRAIGAPYPLDEGIFLVLRPQSLALGPVGADGLTLVVPVRIALRPRWSSSADAGHSLPIAQDTVPGDGLRVVGVIGLHASEVSARLRAALVGRRYVGGARRELRIADAEVQGSGSAVVVRLRLVGPAQGDVYARGRLRLDDTTREVSLVELELDRASASALDQLFDDLELPNLRTVRSPWLDRDAVLRDVVEASRFSLDEPLEQMRTAVGRALASRALTQDAALSEAHLARVELDGGTLRAVGLLVGAFGSGDPEDSPASDAEPAAGDAADSP